MEYIITDNNLCIKDSFLIKKKEFSKIILNLKEKHPECLSLSRRSLYSLKMEWAVHNFLYNCNIKKERTKDVDLNYPCDKPEILYKIIGTLIWIFIK